ncbi:MAG TPA: NAD(P)-dependent oxidoreductase [Pseudomonadales bacterium]|nr:NAD(P)-dependent oxidoreductase [Pseudomonadales bacterium]
MKVLIVGGTGLIGGHCAMLLNQDGHDVTIMARHPAKAPALAALDFMAADYVNDDFTGGQLAAFDAVIFSAAADIRHIPYDGSATPEQHYTRLNDTAVPRFAKACRDAGVSAFVLVDTFYPHVAPQKIGVCPYVTSRANTAAAVRALNTPTFKVCSIGAPFILGHIPGLEMPYIDTLILYAKGQVPDLPVFAPVGGTNHMSATSLAEAVRGALLHGEGGRAYLVGDENYSWKDYLECWFRLANNAQDIPVSEAEHPLFPNMIMFAGVGATVSYEPDADVLKRLDYSRGNMRSTIEHLLHKA